MTTLLRLAIRDDNDCDGKNKHSPQCQKPTTTGGLSIGLAVGLPVLLIAVALGYFLYRNYRKAKKEDMEHDPDFDENGEATALPDFKPYQANSPTGNFNNNPIYEMEDPFDNRNIRSPYGRGYGDNRSLTSAAPSKGVESFILPYHHQMGSKVSLDEYARQLGEYGPSRGSYVPGPSRTRNSSLSNINYLPHPNKATSVSPQKSNLKYENKNYENIPNRTIDDATHDETDDSDDSIDEGLSSHFAINYENELSAKLNKSDEDSFHSGHNETLYDEVQEPVINNVERQASPFGDHANVEDDSKLIEDEHIDGDFDFSNESGLSAAQTMEHDHETANTSTSNLGDKPNHSEITQANSEMTFEADDDMGLGSKSTDPIDNTSVGEDPTVNVARKSPRISKFNLFKNVSDEEDLDENQILSVEQEEELTRMKSVYKLYFDRENTIKKKGGEGQGSSQVFTPDLNQPLPDTEPEPEPEQYLKVNNDIKADTDYNKRLTATSSIYTELNDINHSNSYDPQQQVQQYNDLQQDQRFQQFYQQHLQSLLPLQQLRHPSDIRNSTIQTYTDYQPKSMSITSPQMKQPFVPIENDSVWSSPVNSPTLSNNEFFDNNTNMKSTPSATQLARSSVVMLNPVTEITKQRKFKPAGSLPNVHQNNHAYANYATNGMNQQRQHGSPPQLYQQRSDLIPNSSDDLRKIVNNF